MISDIPKDLFSEWFADRTSRRAGKLLSWILCYLATDKNRWRRKEKKKQSRRIISCYYYYSYFCSINQIYFSPSLFFPLHYKNIV